MNHCLLFTSCSSALIIVGVITAGKAICVTSARLFQAVSMAPAWIPGSARVTPTGVASSVTKVKLKKEEECTVYIYFCVCVCVLNIILHMNRSIHVHCVYSLISPVVR